MALVYIMIVFAITLIVTREEIFFKVRNFFNKDNKIMQVIHSILTCVTCFSTWLGLFIGIFCVLNGIETIPGEYLKISGAFEVLANAFFTAGSVTILNDIYQKIRQ